MNKTLLKVAAAAVLVSQMLTGGAAVQPDRAVAAAAAAASKTPVMLDNLSSYGLKKNYDLPLTLTHGGLSYTLEKIMIYDVKSATAQSLVKKYGYDTTFMTYLIWTKITVENNGDKVIQVTAKDPNPKWLFRLGDREMLFQGMPKTTVWNRNSREALWDLFLKPGEKLTTYQAHFSEAPKIPEKLVIVMAVNGKPKQTFLAGEEE